MRALIQRVHECTVAIEGRPSATIGIGLLVLFGLRRGDTEESAVWLADKIASLRIFEDDDSKMNRSLHDINGEIMIVSQFTLYADTQRGRRPEFTAAMPPDEAEPLYQRFVDLMRRTGLQVQTGQFGARMDISLVNHGPVTIMLEHPR